MKNMLLAMLACTFLFQAHALEYEVQYENDRVSVAKVGMAPREEIGLHSDLHQQIVVPLKGGTVTRLEADGKQVDVAFPTGVAVFRDKDPEGAALHRTVSRSNEPIELVIVQLKDSDSKGAKLKEAVNHYVKAVNRLSHGEDFDQYELFRAILAPNCKKIFNGKCLTNSCDDFVTDLLQVHKTYGIWTIQPVDTIISPESNAAVLRLFVDLETKGKFTEMLMLRFDAESCIEEINIVFSKVEDGYSFDNQHN